MKEKLIILTGPTAVGKTALSIRLAKKINGEIISADSMQVYRGMDIGSAKILPSEQNGIPHHLIDIMDPEESFHVCLFQKLATQCISEITSRGHIPIMVGGTGFYIQSVLYQIDFEATADSTELRLKLEEEYDKDSGYTLYQRLCEIDSDSAAIIHQNNKKRLVRALEFHELYGKKISEHNQMEHQKEAAYDALYFVLNDDRQKIYERIEQRVDWMLQNGLIEEVIALKKRGCDQSMTSMQGLGYKELFAYLDQEISLDEAIYRIKRDTRHFAKRQLTWFRREKNVIFLNRPDYGNDDDRILEAILSRL